MSFQHKELAAGRWAALSVTEQMANIGSEVERAFNWKAKNNPAYAQKAFDRALELIDLTLQNCKIKSRLKEIARVREVLADFFLGQNDFESSEQFLRRYFFQFACATRRNT